MTVFFAEPELVGEVHLQGTLTPGAINPDKCIGPACHTCYLYLYTESQVSTGTASDPWEALYW